MSKLSSLTSLTTMDHGVSKFWKSPPQQAEQVDICSPTSERKGGEGEVVGQGVAHALIL